MVGLLPATDGPRVGVGSGRVRLPAELEGAGLGFWTVSIKGKEIILCELELRTAGLAGSQPATTLTVCDGGGGGFWGIQVVISF